MLDGWVELVKKNVSVRNVGGGENACNFNDWWYFGRSRCVKIIIRLFDSGWWKDESTDVKREGVSLYTTSFWYIIINYATIILPFPYFLYIQSIFRKYIAKMEGNVRHDRLQNRIESRHSSVGEFRSKQWIFLEEKYVAVKSELYRFAFPTRR